MEGREIPLCHKKERRSEGGGGERGGEEHEGVGVKITHRRKVFAIKNVSVVLGGWAVFCQDMCICRKVLLLNRFAPQDTFFLMPILRN